VDLSRVQYDFDRIAGLSARLPERAGPYERWLLRRLPSRIGRALDVGCGGGFTARALARRSDAVLAIDLAPKMIELARQRSIGISNLKFEVADVMAIDLPCESFDCIVSVATLHHLPMEPALLRLRDALAPGGALGIVDLVQSTGVRDRVIDVLAAPMFVASFLRRRTHPELRRAWDEHGRGDVYPTLAQVRQVCDKILPGAAVRRLVRWRYSILWTKPAKR
jgi:SAM-dependent methyltransferase